MPDRESDARILGAAIAFALPPSQREEIRLIVAGLYARIEVLEQTCAQQATALVELERRLSAMEE